MAEHPEVDLDLLVVDGIDAQRLRDNPMWRRVFKSLKDQVDERELNCPTTDKELAADIIRCKQLLLSIEREVERCIDQGHRANNARIKQLERTAKEKVVRVFSRD